MYIFIWKEIWIYSGQYNLYLSSTLINNSIFCCVAPGHWDIRKIKFCAMFSKSSLFKIEYSINIETQCLTNIHLYSKPHFHIFTRKKGPLPMLPESPPCEPQRYQHATMKLRRKCYCSNWNPQNDIDLFWVIVTYSKKDWEDLFSGFALFGTINATPVFVWPTLFYLSLSSGRVQQ